MRFFIIFILPFFLSVNTNQITDNRYIIINYTHTTHIEGSPAEITVNSSLVANSSSSLYEMDYVGNTNHIDEQDGEDGNIFLSIRPSDNPKIYKNLISKTIYNTERIGFKEFLVVDNFSIFNWVLTKNTKEVLGFHCKEAKLHFRGRDYVAYYTMETQFNSGPWKFSGLPGTILEIESTDGVFKIHANSVKIKNGSSMIENPFKESDKFITWEDFIEKYRKKYYELQSYTDPDGGSMSIPKRKIEVLIED